MNVNYFKPLWRNTLVMLLFCFGLSSWGQTYLLQEGFSTTSLPSGWSGDTYFNTTANIGDLSGANGAGFNANNKYLQTPSINSPGILTFNYKGSSSSSQISFKIQKSVNGGAFVDVKVFPKPHSTTVTEGVVEFNENSDNVVIKFVAFDRTGNSLYIDDIQLTQYENVTPTHTLTYTAGPNGTIEGVSPQTVQEDADGTAVTAIPDVGYHFVNWSDASTDNPRTDTNVIENISVTANFAINTYTVTYDGNGSDGGSAPVDGDSPYNHGSNSIALGQGSLTLTDHSFLGWNTQADGLGTFYAENAEITNITSDITLYAQWLDESLDPQTITFGPLSAVTYSDAAFELTATSDSGLPVTYASSNENVATISGNTVTIVGAGTTDITASQIGDGDYQPAVPVVQTLTVNPKNLTIADIIVLDKPYDGTTAAEIDTTVASLVETVVEDEIYFFIEMVTGEFASADVGTDIEITLHYEFVLFGPDAANYTLTQPTLTGNINKADQTISGFENLSKSNTDDPFDLPELTNAEQTVSYESSNTAVATISGNTVTIVGAGTTTITATADGTQNYNPIVTEDNVNITLTITAPYDGVGVFEKITSLEDLTDGYYVIARGTTAMSNNFNSSPYMEGIPVTISDNQIINPTTTTVWKIETNGAGITIFNEVTAKYISVPSNTNTVAVVDGVSNKERFTVTLQSSYFKFSNVEYTTRTLQKNNSLPRFLCYAATQSDLELYKLVPPSTDPLLTVTEEPITGLDYVAGNGPSASQDFEVSGINLDGSAIVVTAPANFEVSTDDETFASSLNLSSTDGTLAETTVYVRLAAGLTAATYSGNITISGGDAPEVTVAVSGEVIDYCMPTSEANDESGITSVSFADINNTSVGDPLYSDFTDITAHVIAGNSYDLIVGVNTFEENTYIVKAWIDWNKNYIFDAGEQYNVGNAYNNGTTPPFSITIPVDTEVGEYRMRIRTMWEPSGVLTACGEIDYTETEDYTITVIPTPSFSLSVNSIAGFTYVAGSGPSNSESFTVSGVNLDGSAITVTAPANFEVSTDDVAFASSLNLSSTDGTLAETTVYVRLMAGLTANTYSGDIAVSGGTAPEVTVAVSGEVTCVAATYSFASTTESKTTDDEAFTNAFTTNNTSATVFASSNPAVATVHPATGEVSIVGAGTTTISVTQVADGTYCAVSASYELTVTTLEPLLVFSGNTDMGSTCFQGDTIQANYTVTNNGGSTANNVVFLNSNPAFQVFPPVSPQNIAPGGFVTFTVTFNPMMGALPNTNNNTLTAMSNGITLASHNITATVNMPISGDVETNAATSETETGVTFNGQITDLGTCWNVTDFGFVYSTSPEPSVATGIMQSTYTGFVNLGAYQFTIDGVLTPGTTYYYKAYVKYNQSFADYYHYGNEESFITTLSTPTATAATNVSSNSFTANWDEVAGATSYEVEVKKTTTSVTEVINQEFTWIDNGTGGNDGSWSGNIASATSGLSDHLTGWTHTTAYKGSNCIKLGSSNTQGVLTTPELGFTGNGTLTFRAGAWDGNSEQTTLRIEITGGGDLSLEQITMVKGAFSNYEVQITGATTATKITFKGWQNSSSRFFIDDIKIIAGGTTQTAIAGSPFTVSAPTTSYQVNGLEIGNTYTYNVKAITADVTTVKSNDVSVITYPEGVIWTSGNAWLNDVQPTTVDDVYVLGNLTVSNSNSFAAKTLTVNGSLTIQAGGVVEVEEGIVNQAAAANFVVENDGILLQNTNASNTGAITVKRNSNPMFRLDYTLWSSPVAMNLVDFSEVSATSPTAGNGTLWNRVYTLGASAWNQVWTTQPDVNNDTTPFVAGQGYLYRSPNAWVIRGNENGDPAQAYPGVFTGVPNNGTVNAATPYEFSAIGNPYPSPIDADILMTENADIDYIYFWTNTHAPLDGSYDDVPNNWAYYNMSGGTATDGGVEPNGTIQPGQGFVAKMINNTNTVNFNNGQRISSNNHFFRQMASERHRFWLNLSNSEEVVFNQILVGYMNNATQGIDTGMDAKMVAYEGNALYSIIENSDENYVIQGRSLPFTASDVVALGFRAVNAGSFTISLHNFDGLFADNQNIYLKDNFTQAVYNLKDGAYSFVSEEGVFNTRFEVVYQTAMSVENPVANNSNWVVYSQENGFQVQTQGFELKTVQVFDLLGRTVYTANAQGTTHNIPSLGAESVYIVKVTTTDNVVLSKKVK